MKKLLLIDGNAIFHRAFHALPLFRDTQGNYTNAVYGFTKMLFEIIQKEKPDYLACAFDHKDKTFRHTEFTEYKANRSLPPPELYPQLPLLFEILQAFEIPVFQQSGFEADDIIGTLSAQAEQEPDLQTVILTGDKDAFQLVSPTVTVVTPLMGISKTASYDPAGVQIKMGLRPDQIVDYKALRGDASDNIPGVKGIGDIQAVKMLQTYDNLDNLYLHLDELTSSQKKKLEENKEMAYLSRKMATIIRDMSIKLDLNCCHVHTIPIEQAKLKLEQLEFKTLLKPLENLARQIEQKLASEQQSSLF
jgi:DNA polymerase I